MERPSSNLRPLSNLCSTDPFEFARTSADLSWTGEKKLWRDGILLLLKLTKGFWVHRFDQIAQEGLDCGVGHCHLPEVGVGGSSEEKCWLKAELHTLKSWSLEEVVLDHVAEDGSLSFSL